MQSIASMLVAFLLLLTACSSSDDEGDTQPSQGTTGQPELSTPTTEPAIVTAKKYESCADATDAVQRAQSRMVDFGAQGLVAKMEIQSRRMAKIVIVNRGCFPSDVVASMPDPDLVEVTQLPDRLNDVTPTRCKPLVREAQALLNFIGGTIASGDLASVKVLRAGFSKLALRDPECLTPALVRAFSTSS